MSIRARNHKHGGALWAKVATAAQTRRLEAAAVEAGASWPGLMEDAGRGMALLARQMLGEARGAGVVVLVGPGNNGGDGLVIARHLHETGSDVVCYLWNRPSSGEDWPLAAARRHGIQVIDATDDPSCAALRRLIAQGDLIVDALLGIGLSRALDEALCEVVACVNAAGKPVLAVDIATGIGSDTGAVLGCAIRATVTAAAGILKPGHLLSPGATFAGVTRVIDLGLPEQLENTTMAETLGARGMRGLVPARPADSNKGTFGKVMVAGGSGRYPGAPFMAASGAMRVGAGLVTLAVGRSAFGSLAAALHEATFLPLPEEEWGTLGGAAATDLLEELGGYRACVVGPGLGREEATKTFVARLLKLEVEKSASGVGFLRAAQTAAREHRPTGSVGFVRTAGPQQATKEQEVKEKEADAPPIFVIDADGLNLLAQTDAWHERLAPGSAILTPHPGEMARLLDIKDVAEVNGDRIEAARTAASNWKQIVVLKGAGTVIADPDGRVAIGPQGNAALATAGTGDVLAGIIGGLIAQGLAPFDAARLGVYLHAEAGARVRDEIGEAGAVAGDLLVRIPQAIRALRSET